MGGIGRVSGRECVIVANDATVKGGTYYPMTVKKHLRAQTVALENRLPCIYLVDSGGAFLPMQDEVFPDRDHFGRIFFNQANLSAAGIPQIASVMGSCTAGGAYVPAMSDESVIVRNQGTIFLGGPPLVKAATGQVVTAEDLGGGDVHARTSGVVDHLAEDDAHALAIVRSVIGTLPPARAVREATAEVEEPHEPPESLYDVVPTDTRTPYDVREVIRRIVDGSRFHEFKSSTATPWCAASPGSGPRGRHRGQQRHPLQRVRPQGRALHRGCATSARSRWCSCRTSPASWSAQYENNGIARDGAKLLVTESRAAWCGSPPSSSAAPSAPATTACAGRAYDPRFLWMWPNARISVMGGDQAAGVLATVRRDALSSRGSAGGEEWRRQTRVFSSRPGRSRRRRPSRWSSTCRTRPRRRAPGPG